MDQNCKIKLLKESLQTGNSIVTNHLYGESMWPLLLEHDRISLIYLLPQHLKSGDIILFQRNETLIAHRLISKNRDHFIVSGDTHTVQEKIDISSYIGVIIAIQKRGIPLTLDRKMIHYTAYIKSGFRHLLTLRKLFGNLWNKQ